MSKSKKQKRDPMRALLDAQNRRRRKAKKEGRCIWCGKKVATSKLTGKPARQCKTHLAIEAERKRLANAAKKKKSKSKRSSKRSPRTSKPIFVAAKHRDGGTFHPGRGELLWSDDLARMPGAEGGSDVNPDDDGGFEGSLPTPEKRRAKKDPTPKKEKAPTPEKPRPRRAKKEPTQEKAPTPEVVIPKPDAPPDAG